MVWSKAVKDTAGLENYYDQHKDEYMWKNRADAITIMSQDSLLLQKAMELTQNNINKKKFSKDFLLEKLCPEDTSGSCITYREAKFEKGDNKRVDATNWTPGPGKIFKNAGEFGFVFIKSEIPPEHKTLDEARGLVTADYQNYLEKEWVESLRKKYPVHVNKDLLKYIN